MKLNQLVMKNGWVNDYCQTTDDTTATIGSTNQGMRTVTKGVKAYTRVTAGDPQVHNVTSHDKGKVRIKKNLTKGIT